MFEKDERVKENKKVDVDALARRKVKWNNAIKEELGGFQTPMKNNDNNTDRDFMEDRASAFNTDFEFRVALYEYERSLVLIFFYFVYLLSYKSLY